jgi:hypothetical protein
MIQQLPTIINNYIFDDYLNFQTYWKQLFKLTIVPIIPAKRLHVNELAKVHFELQMYILKKKLESYSVNGVLFKYDEKPCRVNVDYDRLWVILYSGYRYKNNRRIKITLLFEKHFAYDIYDENDRVIVEASNIFPSILYGDEYEPSYGRHNIEDYDQFINTFMNSLFL